MKKVLVSALLALFVVATFGMIGSNMAKVENRCDKHEFSHSSDEPCRSCNGRGWFKCNMCHGEGWRDCPMCNGDGYIVYRDGSTETCHSCNGKKRFKCGYCDDGHRECDACYGTGKQRYIGH